MVKNEVCIDDGIGGHGRLRVFCHFYHESLSGFSHRVRECGFSLDPAKLLPGISLPCRQVTLLSLML